jgi:pimeloyl-ACP methyl ester carboxylesterase
VLLHSPLVGPITWAPVAEDLDRMEFTVVPDLADDGRQPYWSKHRAAVVGALARVPLDRPVVLVGHSGAGALLSAITGGLRQRVTGYVLVDAGLPADDRTRLDMMESEAADCAQELRRLLASGGRFPDWTDADLASLLADARIREQRRAELSPRPLDFFTEPIPVPPRWLREAPPAYLHLSAAYDNPARLAAREGWPVRRLSGDNHFLLLADPAAVSRALFDLAS